MTDAALALLASTLAGAATGIGALGLAVPLLRRADDSAALSLAAGDMAAAGLFSLILPAWDQARETFGPGQGSVLALAGVALGAAALALVHRLLPHFHPGRGAEGMPLPSATIGAGGMPRHRRLLFVLAIAIHNLPEGLAVGAGFANGVASGATLALGIGLQNLPEGLATALAFRLLGAGPAPAILGALLTGFIEPLAALPGFLAASTSALMLPLALAAAGGAMLYVIVKDILPDLRPLDRRTSVNLVVGFVAMTGLDLFFG